MTTDREWGLPDGVGDTARAERRDAEARVIQAETGAQQTDALVSRVKRSLGEIREMHGENHYRDILLTIMRGSHSRA